MQHFTIEYIAQHAIFLSLMRNPSYNRVYIHVR
jgi:hypothetical protein